MKIEGKDEVLLRKYLLGELNEAEEQELEMQLLADDELCELVLAEEDELVDDYLDGELSEDERERFNSYFMLTPERRRKLKFGEGLRSYGERVEEWFSPEITLSDLSGIESTAGESQIDATSKDPHLRLVSETPGTPDSSTRNWWSYLTLAAAAVIIIGVSLGIWQQLSSKSEIGKGVSALARAYSVERPTEARLTGFGYARAPNTRRSDEPGNIDAESLLLAEMILLREVAAHPSAGAHHALGEVYLSKGNYDDAIKNFDEASKAEPNNAKFENDYGAALLEMGKAEKDRGKALELFSQACERFKKAAALDESLLDALFNEALCHLEMKLDDQAEDEFRRYLERDPNSKWAEEVRQKLSALEIKKQKTSRDNEQLFQDFISAYSSKDDFNGWQAFRLTRSRKGNLITARIIDSYLEALRTTPISKSIDYLQMCSYAGNLEEKNAEDKFTRDLASYYQKTSGSIGPKLIEARNTVKSASDAYEREEYGESAKIYSKAADLFRRVNDSCEAMFCDFWIGVSMLRTNAQQSLNILEPLSRTCNDRGYRYLLAQTLNGVADAKSSLRLISEAIDVGTRTFELAEQLQDPNGMLRSLVNSASMYERLAQYRVSLGCLSRAFDIASLFSPDAYEIWPVYQNLAFNFFSLGNFDASLDYQQKAMQLAFESNLPFLKSRSFARLGLIYDKLHRVDEAIRNGELALAEAEGIKNQESRNNISANSTLMLAHMYREHGQLARALTLYDHALDLHRELKIESYLFEAHHGKLSALSALNDDRATEAEINTAVEIVEQYRSGITDDNGRSSFFDTAQAIYNLAIDFSYERLHRLDRAFQFAESSRARSLLDLMRTASTNNPNSLSVSVTPPLTLEKIWQQMPDDSQIIQFSVLDKRTLAWVISKGTLDGREIPIASEALKDQVLSFRALIGSPESDRELVQQKGRELYELLIVPVEELLKPNTYVCIVPDNILTSVPFDALISPDTGHFLIEDRCFGIAPSATIFVESTLDASRKQKRPIDSERLLAVGY